MDILNLEPNDDDEYAEDAEFEAEEEAESSGLKEPTKLEKFTRRKSFKIGIAGLSLYTLVLIGETIGALVTLNGAKPLEYGQGVTMTVPCDQDGITITAIGRSENISSNPQFYLDGLKFSNISDTCINRIFKIAIYDIHGNKVNLGYKNMATGASTGDDATYARLYITRQNNDSGGLDWRVMPSSTFPTPPSEDGLSLCGGDFDLSDQVNYDFGTSVPKPGCPAENYMTHWRGYILMPGSDDGNEHTTNFSLNLTGQAVMNIGGDNVITELGDGSEKTVTGSYSMLKGSAYPLDLWVYHATGTSKVSLSWDETGSNALMPAEVFQWDSALSVKVSNTEGLTDYVVSSTSSTPNQRNFILHFNRPIQTDVPQKITVETSRS